jgi:hypothetical protein
MIAAPICNLSIFRVAWLRASRSHVFVAIDQKHAYAKRESMPPKMGCINFLQFLRFLPNPFTIFLQKRSSDRADGSISDLVFFHRDHGQDFRGAIG